MESHLVQQQKSLLVKIPDISNALQALRLLIRKSETVSCHFELADSVYANAKIQKEDSVLLWLGANVMLEYNYEEAEALLTKNLKVAFKPTHAVQAREMHAQLARRVSKRAMSTASRGHSLKAVMGGQPARRDATRGQPNSSRWPTLGSLSGLRGTHPFLRFVIDSSWLRSLALVSDTHAACLAAASLLFRMRR